MTPAERKRRMRAIIDQHAEAARTFRATRAALDDATPGIDYSITGLRRTLVALEHANEAQRVALDAIIAANEAALALYNDDE